MILSSFTKVVLCLLIEDLLFYSRSIRGLVYSLRKAMNSDVDGFFVDGNMYIFLFQRCKVGKTFSEKLGLGLMEDLYTSE